MDFGALLDRLMQVDPRLLWPFIVDVLKNPGTQPAAFAAVLGGIAILTLLLVMAVVLVSMSAGGDDEDEYYYEDDEEAPISVVPVVVEPEEPEEPEEPRTPMARWLFTTLWIAAFAAVWIVGGIVSERDAVCLSCHGSQPYHVARNNPKLKDPHRKVSCVACHEGGNAVTRVTTAVPLRGVHYVFGMLGRGTTAREYGTPVANRSCASCHKKALSGTIVNASQGVRMSHAEPLRAKAQCADCHATHKDTGVTDAVTVGMAPCLRCHNQQQASAKCEYCHTKDIALAVRSRGAVQPRVHSTVDWKCSSCHTDQTRCNRCHGTSMPHTEAFKNGGHAREAVLDIWLNNGQGCKRCHGPNHRPCQACHTGTFPAHGSPSWLKDHQAADPNQNGCDNCHGYRAWMAGRNFCEDCHPDISINGKSSAKRSAVTTTGGTP